MKVLRRRAVMSHDPTRAGTMPQPTPDGADRAWVAWESKVRIAVLAAALFMALC